MSQFILLFQFYYYSCNLSISLHIPNLTWFDWEGSLGTYLFVTLETADCVTSQQNIIGCWEGDDNVSGRSITLLTALSFSCTLLKALATLRIMLWIFCDDDRTGFLRMIIGRLCSGNM